MLSRRRAGRKSNEGTPGEGRRDPIEWTSLPSASVLAYGEGGASAEKLTIQLIPKRSVRLPK